MNTLNCGRVHPPPPPPLPAPPPKTDISAVCIPNTKSKSNKRGMPIAPWGILKLIHLHLIITSDPKTPAMSPMLDSEKKRRAEL